MDYFTRAISFLLFLLAVAFFRLLVAKGLVGAGKLASDSRWIPATIRSFTRTREYLNLVQGELVVEAVESMSELVLVPQELADQIAGTQVEVLDLSYLESVRTDAWPSTSQEVLAVIAAHVGAEVRHHDDYLEVAYHEPGRGIRIQAVHDGQGLSFEADFDAPDWLTDDMEVEFDAVPIETDALSLTRDGVQVTVDDGSGRVTAEELDRFVPTDIQRVYAFVDVTLAPVVVGPGFILGDPDPVLLHPDVVFSLLDEFLAIADLLEAQVPSQQLPNDERLGDDAPEEGLW